MGWKLVSPWSWKKSSLIAWNFLNESNSAPVATDELADRQFIAGSSERAGNLPGLICQKNALALFRCNMSCFSTQGSWGWRVVHWCCHLAMPHTDRTRLYSKLMCNYFALACHALAPDLPGGVQQFELADVFT